MPTTKWLHWRLSEWRLATSLAGNEVCKRQAVRQSSNRPVWSALSSAQAIAGRIGLHGCCSQQLLLQLLRQQRATAAAAGEGGQDEKRTRKEEEDDEEKCDLSRQQMKVSEPQTTNIRNRDSKRAREDQ